MIYIDPPYNTGKEFIYPDRFQDNLDTYLKYTGQKDDEGFKISSNTESSGRYHTNWLNMMLPRLKLARGLLRDDGVIFVSIDDNEVANLRKCCDEIFGYDNFIANIVWQKKYTRSNDAKWFSDSDVEFWFARDLQKLLGYAEWRNFLKVVEKAQEACDNSGASVQNHFVDVNKMVELGSGAKREIDDVMLTNVSEMIIITHKSSLKRRS